MNQDIRSSGVTAQESALLASYFGDAMTRLKTMVLKPVGGTKASKAFRQGRAAGLVNQVDDVLRELNSKTSGWVGAKMPKAYKAGLAIGVNQAKSAGVKVEGQAAQGSFSVISTRAVVVLARDTAADLNKAAGVMGEQAKDVLRHTAQMGLSEAEINKILAGGLIEGEPVATIRKLREALKKVHGETVEITDKNGNPRNYDVKYYAEMVARTKTREATVDARHEKLQELDLDLVAIVGRLSPAFCSAFLGQVFSLGGKSKKYPAYASLPGGGPPFHPNCSKSTRPFIEELAEPDQIKNARGLGDAHKLLGMDATKAQRSFKDLQIQQQMEKHYTN